MVDHIGVFFRFLTFTLTIFGLSSSYLFVGGGGGFAQRFTERKIFLKKIYCDLF